MTKKRKNGNKNNCKGVSGLSNEFGTIAMSTSYNQNLEEFPNGVTWGREDRFKHLEFKLNLIQHNTKFFLEVMHNQKSDTLEWIIIVLISAEICIGLCDLFNIRPV